MKTMKNIISLIFVCGLSVHAVMADGGWPPKKGKGFFKLGQGMIRATQFYTSSGDLQDIPTTSLYTTSLYGEYGFSDRISGLVYLPFFVRSTINRQEFRQSGKIIGEGDEVNALGDTDIGITYALNRDKKVALSASLILGLPLGETQGGRGKLLQTGDGEFNQYLKMAAGISFYPKPLFAAAHIGVNNRTKKFSEEFRYGMEVGYTGIKKLTALLKVNSVVPLRNGEDGGTANGIFSNNTQFFAVSPTFLYEVKANAGLLFSAGFAPSGQRILAAPSLELGVFLKR